MQKAYIIAFFAFVGIANFAVYQVRQAASIREEYQPSSDVVIAEHLAKQVAELKVLSVTETLQRLSEMEDYLYPGAFIGAEMIFLSDNDGNIFAENIYQHQSNELERILSNRAFRKALQDLNELPKDQASELLLSEFDNTLPEYLILYDDFAKVPSRTFVLQSADGQPVLLGVRKKLFALMLIAGSLGLTDVHKAIEKIDAISQNQKVDVRRIEDPDIRADHSLMALLHNNLVLASGLYGTSPRKEDAALKPFADRFASRRIVDFSAPATEYDVMVRHGVLVPRPDKEYIDIRYFAQMTDEDLAELRRILASHEP
ncbi:MAG: hypothetical protein FWG73_07385 [Planctomycetaceae bacterium]|nr:hypothetical protein [Planctomycetaceae bacterium]